MAYMFHVGLNRRVITLAALFALIMTAPFGWFAVAAWLVTALITFVIARFAIRRLGGLTGDIYGMTCECVEAAVLVTSTLFIGRT
jgi:adenosylcobinamide-GDP ribazoletransferase